MTTNYPIRIMKRVFTVGLFAAAGLLLSYRLLAAETPPRPNAMLHQQGVKIVDEHGAEVRLRGVNLGGWLLWEGWIFGKGILTSETTIHNRLEKVIGRQATDEFRNQVYENFVTEANIAKIAAAGFNVVRLPLNHRLFQRDDAWKILDRLLSWCERHKVYVVLDLHAVPGGQSALGMADPADARRLVWRSEESQQQTAELWKSIAARCHNRKIVAGYDLVNEPAPPSGEALVNLYRRIIRAIRAKDPDHMIFLEGAKFASDFSMFDQPLCENQAYSFHMYTWFGDDRKQALARYQALAEKQNTPLWCGEFGENTYQMIGTTVQMYAEMPEINGWAFWTWKRAPSKSPGLVTIKTPENWRGVMEWVGSLFEGRKPDAATARAGIKEFVEAMKLKNTNYDLRMQDALLPKR